METQTLPRLTSIGRELDTSPDTFGFLRSSSHLTDDAEALQSRMSDDGYLFLPGVLHRDEVINARRVITDRLAADGLLDPSAPPFEGRLRADSPNPYFRPDVVAGNSALLSVVYDGPLMAIAARLLSGPVRHFDFTWFRAVGPGHGTQPHCDMVYMGRGTKNLYTAWTPFGDISLTVGGLMILENSHRRGELREYQKQDVDSYCENGPNAEKVQTGAMHWEHWDGSGRDWNGAITDNPTALQKTLGGRWLTAENYRMGDVLLFSMRTVHASIDNATRLIRLSSDTRYQLASDPVDERWVGENPPGHGLAVKRGRIC